MAAIIKSIPCHSVEAVNLAINTVLKENKHQFEENLKKLAEVLDLEPQRKRKHLLEDIPFHPVSVCSTIRSYRRFEQVWRNTTVQKAGQ